MAGFVKALLPLLRAATARKALPPAPTRKALTTGQPAGRVTSPAPVPLAQRLANAPVAPKVHKRGARKPTTGGPPGGLIKSVDGSGRVTGYMAYDSNGYAVKRVDLTGSTHAGIPTPHVSDYVHDRAPDGTIFVREDRRSVRPAQPQELP